LSRVGSGQPPLGLENFPLKIPNFSTFCPSGQKISLVGSKNTWVKYRLASYLLWVKSMLGSGRPTLLQIVCLVFKNQDSKISLTDLGSFAQCMLANYASLSNMALGSVMTNPEPNPRVSLLKGGLVGIDEASPAGLGRGNTLWGVCWVRLG